MKITTAIAILLLCNTVLYSTEKSSPETWRYPANGASSEDQITLGRAGNVKTYRLSTEDSAEKVVAWYCERLGLDKDHSLVQAATAGFATTKKDINGSWIVYRDTTERNTAGVVLANISSEHSHVTIYLRPSFASRDALSISISGTSKRTSIILTEPTQD